MVKARFTKRKEDNEILHGSSFCRIRIWNIFGFLFLLVAFFYARMFVRLEVHTRNLLDPNTLLESMMTTSSNPATTATTNAVTIGYFVSITKCAKSWVPMVDGAAVLKHSVHLASVHGDLGGRYDYKMHAIYHPDAATCVLPLAKLGYELVRRETPVKKEEIKGDFLRSRISGNGCCGESELIKLEAYTFTEFPVVVHLDLDVIILKPLDAMFDSMLMENVRGGPNDPINRVERMWPDDPVPEKINAFFTRDYGVVNWNIPYKPAQGGFLILRPDKTVYEEYLGIVREGDFREGLGWGGLVGPFYGAMTVQGLLPYYYDVLRPGQIVVLNNCVYNNMCNNPSDEPTVKEVLKGKCRSGKPMNECEDCRRRPLEDIVSTHFTICQKPWFCLPYAQNKIDHRQCRKLGREWFRIRADLEKSWGRSGTGPSAAGDYVHRDHFYGYCRKTGQDGYIPIEQPYGKAVLKKDQ